jgi:hypothetical protein
MEKTINTEFDILLELKIILTVELEIKHLPQNKKN